MGLLMFSWLRRLVVGLFGEDDSRLRNTCAPRKAYGYDEAVRLYRRDGQWYADLRRHGNVQALRAYYGTDQVPTGFAASCEAVDVRGVVVSTYGARVVIDTQ